MLPGLDPCKTMIKRILNSKSKTIFSAAFILGAASLASRLLGLVRDRLLAGKFGAGDELDIYYAAFRLPDLVFSILIMGAISSALIPVFAEYFEKNKSKAWDLLSRILNLGLVSLIIIAGILAVLAPLIINIVAPGFTGAKKEMTILLTRIMFLSPVILGISTILSGVLQYFRRFFVYSITPIIYNLGIIIGILFLVPRWGLKGLAWGVVLGALLHLIIQLPSIFYSGFSWKPSFSLYDRGVRRVIKLMLPRTLGLAGFQINFLVITAIASTLTAGSIAVFNLAKNLQYVPVGIFGIAFATAVFPNLTRAFTKKNKKEFSKDFSSIFSQILFLIIPFSILFFLLRAQIVRIVLGTGKFGWTDTRLTAAVLGIFALSIFAQGLIPMISRGFYAFHNTKIPVLISLVSFFINICLSYGLVWAINNLNSISFFLSKVLKLQGIEQISILGLPLAFSFSNVIYFIILLKLFDKKINWWLPKQIKNSFFKIAFAAIFMSMTTYSLLYVVDLFIYTHTFIGIFAQTIIACLGGLTIYIIFTALLHSPELSNIKNLIFKKQIK